LGAVRGANLGFFFKTYMAYNNLPCTTVQACEDKQVPCELIDEKGVSFR
jgi:hypothetical protein